MMKMKKKFLSVLLALLLLSLTACGGGPSLSGGDTGPSSSDSVSSSNQENGWGGGEFYDDAAAEVAASEDAGCGSILPANTKLIYSADIAMETTEFDAAEQSISRIVENLGGWFESRSIYQGGGSRSLRCTVRVPAKSFQSFLEQAGQAAHVTSRDEYTEDVSEAYYDQESRLVTQRTKLDRLHALLAQATEMEAIISLENAISDTELEIEQLTGSLRKYDSLVGYSTITLRLEEVYKLSTDEEVAVTFGQRLGRAFALGLRRGVSGLEEFSIAAAQNWFNLLILAAIAAAAVLFLRRRRKRVSAPRPPKPPQPPKPPESKE